MRYSTKCCVLILAATITALALRLPRLAQRPMHGDEAVHADKFGDLLEKGVYKYDPNEYHGPTLNYLTLLPARLASAENLTQVTEFHLRIVPVFFGVLLVLLLLLIVDGLGPHSTVYAAVLTAISPAMVFYSRYYIQEMLLVCFTFGVIVFGYRYTQRKNIAWALLAGICLGLMHATKETSIIAFGSMLLALGLTLSIRRRKPRDEGRGKRDASIVNRLSSIHLIAGLAAGAVVSALFHSSFLTNPGGILDSFRTYTTYLGRAGSNIRHIKPWNYYLETLLFFRFADGPIWTEAVIVLLSIVGFIAAITKKGISFANADLLRFIAFYTLVMTAIYSVIPYKTPWCMLGFLHGMILLAGVGAVVLVRLMPNVLPRLIVLLLLFDVSVHLLWQAHMSSYKFYADCRNPYVYAHPTTEVFEIVKRVEQYAEVHEDGHNMPIQVICPGDDYWPLPWYFRSFSKVGWQNKVDVKPLFSIGLEFESDLDRVTISEELRQEFEKNESPLSLYVALSVEEAGSTWLITDKFKEYYVKKEEDILNIYDVSVPPAPLIIASPTVEAVVAYKLYSLTPLYKRQVYMFLFDEPYYVWLRPTINLKGKLKGFVRKDLWDLCNKGPDPNELIRKASEK